MCTAANPRLAVSTAHQSDNSNASLNLYASNLGAQKGLVSIDAYDRQLASIRVL